MHVQLQHVAIARPPGSDAAARAFYDELLGLTEIAPPPSLQTLGVLSYKSARAANCTSLWRSHWVKIA